MRKILLASDLDNTLIHSYKHKREGDICVEMLNGAEQGLMSAKVHAQLSSLPDNVELVPLTTRSVAQFERIQLPEGCYSRAITTNGAILIEKGIQNEKWRMSEKHYADELMPLMEKLRAELDGNEKLNVVRIVDEMYLYISCAKPEYVGEFMDRYSTLTELDVMLSGRKIYFLPPEINKGKGLKRLVQGEKDAFIFAAGDSTIDLPMLEAADLAIIPEALDSLLENSNRSVFKGDGDFAEFVIETLIDKCKK